MKKTLLMMFFFMATAFVANAQRGGGHHQHYQPYYNGGHCNTRPIFTSFGYGCNNYGRRPFINVVIAPRPRVISQPPPVYNEPRIVKEWVEAHWEETPNGRIWVEGHYIQREVY